MQTNNQETENYQLEHKYYRNNFIFLVLGSTTSKFGRIIFNFIVTQYIALYGNSNLLAIFQSSNNIVSIIFNFIGGVISDLKNRKNILIITDFLAALVCFLLVFFTDSIYSIELIIVGNITLAILYSFNSPTYKSIVKKAINKNSILKYNSAINLSGELIKFIAPFIGVMIFSIFGMKIGFIINGMIFLVSAILEFYIKIGDSITSSKRSFFIEFKNGLAYLFQNKPLLVSVIVASLVNFFIAGYNFLIPYSYKFLTSAGHNFYSYILATSAVGSMVISFIVIKFFKTQSLATKMQFPISLCGLSLLLIPIFEFFQIKLLILQLMPYLLYSMFMTLFNIVFFTYVQNIVSNEYLGRVFSVIFTTAVLFMPIGTYMFSQFLPIAATTYFYVGGGTFIVGLMYYVYERITQS